MKWFENLFRFFIIRRKLNKSLRLLSHEEIESFIELDREKSFFLELAKEIKSVRAKEIKIDFDMDTYYDIKNRSHWKKPVIKGEFKIRCCSWVYLEASALPGEDYKISYTLTQKANVVLEGEDMEVKDVFKALRKKFHIRLYK